MWDNRALALLIYLMFGFFNRVLSWDIIIKYLTMNKIIALALLALVISALQLDNLHEKTTVSAQKTTPTSPHHPTQQPHTGPQQQSQVNRNSQQRVSNKREGYEPEAGDPFGRDTATKVTCFKSPCFEPSRGCSAPKSWHTIFYLIPTTNGQKGRFVGYECKWNDKDLSD